VRIGVVYPQTEFGHDSGAIREYAQTAEGLGYKHILTYDHILGANPERPGGWRGPYTHRHPFQEPFVLFGFMAGLTESIEFVTGILILPQRQTALVAKQAATLDVLSGGRLRLGVGIGWNRIEYEALNEEFHTRGRRVEEQIELLRRLWTEPLVNFDGEWHSVPDAGLNPLPLQRPIPIWLGGDADAVLRRVATIGDGWMPNNRRAADAQPALDKIGRYLAEAGRNWGEVGLEPRLLFGDGDSERWAADLAEWQVAGATHLSINTMHAGFQTASEHISAISKFAEAMGL
jgi:probable F420-dependent oxidoreductase